ncbi:MAG TPA: iron-sulfur cluster assembly accessory protein [Bryobacteraceae bacterium]|jgi:iron-sulfur cluster assembly protein
MENPPIQITPKAIARIHALLHQNHCEGGLRLGIVGGGCSGMSYKFKLESHPRPVDKVFKYEGVSVFVDPKSYAYLKGMTLDYTESLLESAFVFQNPNAKRHCSCGKSFLA